MKPTRKTMSECYVDSDLRSKNAVNETEIDGNTGNINYLSL